MTRIQEYLRPRTPEEAVVAKAQRPGGFFLAGGTDALVNTPDGWTLAIDIIGLGLSEVRGYNGTVEIGATALLRDIERHAAIQPVASGALREAIRETGPWLIRNAATLTGNICNASPSADSAPMLLTLDAELALSDGSALPLDGFFTGPHRTVLGNRLVTAIRVHPRDRRGHFQKLSRSKSDIAQVNMAVTARFDGDIANDVRIAFGSVGPTPLRAKRAEAIIEGNRLSVDVITAAVDAARAEIAPIDDWRASAKYRRHSAGVMLDRALRGLAVA